VPRPSSLSSGSRRLQSYIMWLVCPAVVSSSPLHAQVTAETYEHRSRIHQVSSLDTPAVEHRSQESSTPTPSLNAAPRPAAIADRDENSLPSFAQYRASPDQSDAPFKERNQLAGPAVTVTSSLAVVLGLFALMVWLSRRFGNRSLGQTALPSEVLQSLGTAALDARTKINLVKCGGRVLVVAQTATGVFPLSEITSPEEVRHLIAQCQPMSKQSFAQTLQAFEREPAPKGFVGREVPTTEVNPPRPTRGRLFTTA